MLEPIINILEGLISSEIISEELGRVISTLEGLIDAEIVDVDAKSEYLVLERITRDKIQGVIERFERTIKDVDWSVLEGKYVVEWERYDRYTHKPTLVSSLPPTSKPAKIILINELLSEQIRNPNTKDDFFVALEVDALVDGETAHILYQSLIDIIFTPDGKDLRKEMSIWIYPLYSPGKKYHEHWMSYRGGHYKEYLKHSVDEEHDDVDSKANHDEDTGKMQEWIKTNPEQVAKMPPPYWGSQEKAAYEKHLTDQEHLEKELKKAQLLDSVIWPIIPSQQPPRFSLVPARYFKEAIYVFKPVPTQYSKKYPLLHFVRSSLGGWKGNFNEKEKADIIGRLILSDDEYYVLLDPNTYMSGSDVIKNVLVAKAAIPSMKLLDEMKRTNRFKAVKVDLLNL